MRFEDERYVRNYTRDTTTILMLHWQARAIMWEIFRKTDRAGLLDLGEDGLDALAATIRYPVDVVREHMPELLRRKVFELRADGMLIAPRFVEAQEAVQSDKARARASRERARDLARAKEVGVTVRDGADTNRDDTVTWRDETVTPGHDASRSVTLCCAVPSVPSVPNHPLDPAAAGAEANESPEVAKRDVKPARSRGTRIQEDWTPSEATLEWATKERIRNPLVCLDEFRDYWRGVPGQKGLKVDWDGTYRNRLRQLLDAGKLELVTAPPARASGPRAVVQDPADPFVPPPPEVLEALARAQAKLFLEDPGADVRLPPKTGGVHGR